MERLSLKVPMKITNTIAQDSIVTVDQKRQVMAVHRLHPQRVVVAMEQVDHPTHPNENIIQMVDQGRLHRYLRDMKDEKNVPLVTNKKSVRLNTLKVNQVIN